VTSDIPNYAVVGGNPAKVVKMRFDDETITKLVNIAWWNWSAKKITENLEAIVGVDLSILEESKENNETD